MSLQAKTLFAEEALLPAGWARDVRVAIGADGRIAEVQENAAPQAGDEKLAPGKTLLPAVSNLHSHAFQRVMAGLSEYRTSESDSFWTWREVMYRVASSLTPEECRAVAALAFMEMAEAGYAAVAEFHYLHHQPDGTPYDNLAEMSARIAAAANETGLGLALLPVYYAYGGAGQAPLSDAQKRFGSTLESYEQLRAAITSMMKSAPSDFSVGTAFHSLRAIAPDDIAALAFIGEGEVFHIHAAEQEKEIEDVRQWLGARPVEWLLDNVPVGENWCLVHATHMTEAETKSLARAGAVAGLCPVTEANLGDGIFNGDAYFHAGGRFGVGTDSNVKIALSDELRMLEYAQRLHLRKRNILADADKSTGRSLYEKALEGGGAALGRKSGRIEKECWADLVAVAPSAFDVIGEKSDRLLDSWIFAGDDVGVCDLWSAGRHIVKDGRHQKRDEIRARFKKVAAKLKDRLG
ncbi:MAG: formimidoylglutamate deiminase [Alphaproteobacteria bacterium]|nr:formimidoylglutamate deiminase [Alphaproteobacteria bacterium]